MIDQTPVKVSAHDRLIRTAEIAATSEINTDYVAKYRETIDEMKAGQETLIALGLYALVEDGKIYFRREGTELLHFNTLVAERAITLLFVQASRTKQAILKKLWEFHRDNMLLYRGENGIEYNPEDLPQYVNEKFSKLMDDDPYYTDQMVFIILRILQPVYARQLQNKPFVTPEGEVITAELLVDSPKMLTKLRDMSYVFEESEPEQQQELLNAAVNGTVDDVKQVKNQIKNPGGAKITGSWTVHSKGDSYSVEMSDLSEEQINYIEKALGLGWVQILR